MRSFETSTGSTRVVFGSGTLRRLPDELVRLGGGRALVLSTPGRTALARRVAEVLGDRTVGVFDQAAMHTPVEVTDRAVAHLDRVAADVVVAVGGGSTTGLAKALAVRRPVRQVVLPTTYAGSEVTAVLGETENGEKTTRSAPEIQPDTVIYDVDLTRDLPWSVSLTSAVNAMAHGVEALYAVERTDDTDAMATTALTSLATGLRDLHAAPDSTDARTELLYGAWLAGSCLGAVGMGLHHKLCHTLGGSFGLPHAPTHTVVLPYAMAYNAPAAPAAIAAAASALAVPDAPSGVQDLVRRLGGPTRLADLGFRTADIPDAARLATARPYPNPREVTSRGIVNLLEQATSGEPTGLGEPRQQG